MCRINTDFKSHILYQWIKKYTHSFDETNGAKKKENENKNGFISAAHRCACWALHNVFLLLFVRFTHTKIWVNFFVVCQSMPHPLDSDAKAHSPRTDDMIILAFDL